MKAAFFLTTGLAAILAGPTLAADGTGSAPNLFGPWGRHAFNFEPMPSGPQPLVNLIRKPDGTNDLGTLVGDYRNPILKPEAAEAVKKHGEISLSGHAYPDPSNQCGPYAPPFTFAMQLGLEMLQKKDSIIILYHQDDQIRFVRLNAPHPAHVVPSAMGDSVGHYEGDTLVVDTIGIETGPLTMVDRWGTPHSKALHVVERYRLIDGAVAKAAQDHWQKTDGTAGVGGVQLDPDPSHKGLQLEVTVEDPAVFTAPWSAFVTYRHKTNPWEELVCAENPANYYQGMSSDFPRSDKPDF
jgi:hypothetical protein